MSVLEGETNPFLHDPVVECLFDYLPLKDIKKFRLVCTTWNFVSEPFLRKRGKVMFLDAFRPATFLEYCDSHLPVVPFTSFKFTNLSTRKNPESNWTVTEIPNFLALYGTNIKSLEFDNLNAFLNETGGGPIDVLGSHLHEYIDLAPNIVDIKIVGVNQFSCVISLIKLVSLKTIFLESCAVSWDYIDDRIIPLKLNLRNVEFKLIGNEFYGISLNDFFDFSQCTEIQYHDNYISTAMYFDMSSIVSVRKLDLHCPQLQILNWPISYAEIDHLVLKRQPFIKKTELKIKKLTLSSSDVNLSLLPKTIEELTFAGGVECFSLHLELPYLKKLTLIEEGFAEQKFEILSHFKSCSNLTNLILEIVSVSKEYQLNFSWIPPTIKRIKLAGLKRFHFVFDAVIDVDILELDNDKISEAQNLIYNIRPKVFMCSGISKLECDDFIEFVLKNTQIEKIFIGFSIVSDFGYTVTQNFSNYVDMEYWVYEFENCRGKAITEADFESLREWSQ